MRDDTKAATTNGATTNGATTNAASGVETAAVSSAATIATPGARARGGPGGDRPRASAPSGSGRAEGDGAAGTEMLTFSRAAPALELRKAEFDLAVHLGYVRTVRDAAGGAGSASVTGTGTRVRRGAVPRGEIDRLRATDGFPGALQERVRTVGTAEAAGILAITAARFTRLARMGHLTPVRFSVNRYRAVVWMYLASEVHEFARRNPDLLVGKLPAPLRTRVASGEDWRARNWRGRRLGALLRQADGSLERAAAFASLLDPAQVAEVVDDPYERVCLERLRPEPPYAHAESSAVREVTALLLQADDPDEVLWCRTGLARSLDEARASCQALRPDGGLERLPGRGSRAPALLTGNGVSEVDVAPARACAWRPPMNRCDAVGHRGSPGRATKGLPERTLRRRPSPSPTG
ncbi:DUF6397 family protein [Streptomyces sp. NPDC059165]|uniref:DUF6397 family protein n=1 Tax=Streptomyces sp. NPDC059165 TaxID=3346751 RepID=UPI0036C51BA5